MTDPPEHGPDSATPPNGPGTGNSGTNATSAKGKRQRRRRKGDSKATQKATQKPGKHRKRRHTPRGTAADVEHLKTIVLERILLGERRRDILRFLSKAIEADDLRWPTKGGPSSRTVDDYIAKATEELRKLSSVDRAEAMAAARGRFLMIMRKANDAGDLSTARLANRDLARIDGLEPVRVQHSGSVLTEHTHSGTVQHEHTARPATIDEQATRIGDIMAIARQRQTAAAGSVPASAPPGTNPANN